MKDKVSKNFFGVAILNVIITLAEFIGGFMSGSLALLSDAVHNLGDVGAIILSFVAHLVGKKKQNSNKTFGYKRAEIIAAFVNAFILLAMTVYLVIEAFERLNDQVTIDGELMLIIAVIGLIANFISMLIMHQHSKDNVNIKSVFLHMLSDALSSIGVIIAAILINVYHIMWVDAAITVIVSVVLAYEAIKILKNTLNILMESNPDIDLKKVESDLCQFELINTIHHVHVWQFSDSEIMLDAHVNVNPKIKVSQLDGLYDQINRVLKQNFGISHVTIQVESARGLNEKIIPHGENEK
ncbi:cation diffusion facilitator family transporter [Holzapfeliella floricola]|uniref:Cation diffusion facilitator family transporter n=1 Tax=Holzapfeliella floricola DSM 23037 = JCM 16512 TaxID=1423744 RepID=A0A0R2DUU3_9LACO|nr:cation diffusion facilitator family transporter [Holzapfeliella floricola]KRN04250.1 cation diffusion facilitator family transporter [Holzapfeliella floricola DSM 23037 = JCM 16512]